MLIRNFELSAKVEQVSVKRFLEIYEIKGNLGRCLVALKNATPEELKEIKKEIPKITILGLEVDKLLGL